MLPEIGKLTGESRPDQKYKRGIVQNGYESILLKPADFASV